MTTIEQIKSALQAHIAEAEAATPGPWMCLHQGEQEHPGIEAGNMSVVIMGWRDVDTDDGGVRGNTDEEALANAAFITHARTMSPLVCRGYLQTIEWLEEDASYTGERYCPGNEYAHGVEYGKSIIGVKAYRRLESIRLEWHNLTTK